MAEDKIIQTTAVRRVAPYRGALRSADWNDSEEEKVESISQLTNAINSLHNRLDRSLVIAEQENSWLRRQIDSLLRQRDYNEQITGKAGNIISRLIDLSDTTGITYPNSTVDSSSAMVAAEYGEATLPALAIENKFYTISIKTNKLLPPNGLVIDVNGTFDKGLGDGLVDYEQGGVITEGKPEWAFNGNNQQYWVRRVEFPIDAKVDQVEVQLIVTVPEGASRDANLIDLNPFPNGSVDITQLSIASDLGTVFTTVSGFTETFNAKARRYHFPATPVDQILVRLRQRNWVEENGKKVFYYGLQELGLKLVDYDKRYTPGAALGTNHSFIIKFSAPAGYTFLDIHRIDSTPDFLSEDNGHRHIHLKLSADPEAGNVLWDSDTFLTPQKANAAINCAGNDTLYWIVELNWVEDQGGVLSPYEVGTTPYVSAIGVSFTTQEV